MADVRVDRFRIRSASTTGATVAVGRFRVRSAANAHVRVSRFRVRSNGDTLTVNPGSDLVGLEPFTERRLVAVVTSTLPAVTVWSQVSGPPVQIVGRLRGRRSRRPWFSG
jgi:hypothetical protein